MPAVQTAAAALAVHTAAGGAVLLGQPAVGVFPAAPAAIAPSFRSPTLARTHFFGPRPIAGIGVPLFVGPPAYYDPAYAAPPPVVYPPPRRHRRPRPRRRSGSSIRTGVTSCAAMV